mmetsp:Transcript_108177/g.305854  ORF Transcript_108177/g.305854 Transcript_108177/m.305854 type:complete len:466 (+) Transcript_108177:498-1895(+)
MGPLEKAPRVFCPRDPLPAHGEGLLLLPGGAPVRGAEHHQQLRPVPAPDEGARLPLRVLGEGGVDRARLREPPGTTQVQVLARRPGAPGNWPAGLVRGAPVRHRGRRPGRPDPEAGVWPAGSAYGGAQRAHRGAAHHRLGPAFERARQHPAFRRAPLPYGRGGAQARPPALHVHLQRPAPLGGALAVQDHAHRHPELQEDAADPRTLWPDLVCERPGRPAPSAAAGQVLHGGGAVVRDRAPAANGQEGRARRLLRRPLERSSPRGGRGGDTATLRRALRAGRGAAGAARAGDTGETPRRECGGRSPRPGEAAGADLRLRLLRHRPRPEHDVGPRGEGQRRGVARAEGGDAERHRAGAGGGGRAEPGPPRGRHRVAGHQRLGHGHRERRAGVLRDVRRAEAPPAGAGSPETAERHRIAGRALVPAHPCAPPQDRRARNRQEGGARRAPCGAGAAEARAGASDARHC